MKAQPKPESISTWIISFAGLAVASALMGCASTGYDRSDAAAHSFQSTASEIQSESLALDTTLAALKDLVNKPAADLKVQFHVYETSLDRLIAASNRAESSGRVMRARNEAYLQAWDKQLAEMNYEHIRKSSEARKVEVCNQFEAVDKRYEEMHSALVPLTAYLEDIRKALSADLTREGLDAVKPIVAKADENAARVQTALGKLATDLTISGTRLSSVAVQRAPGPAVQGEVRTDAVTQ
jgi:hypothetical protein